MRAIFCLSHHSALSHTILQGDGEWANWMSMDSMEVRGCRVWWLWWLMANVGWCRVVKSRIMHAGPWIP